ncbi:MAG: glutaminyl-peptide cyclotransferase [Mucilaginibacter sp.]|uniref:glutaminyl-peptide cyclotransferase n=1 Tax=Mucilaginibacter sp. TaxID=1882438 RepID=UPI003264BC3B
MSNRRKLIFHSIIIALIFGCQPKMQHDTDITLSPESGTSYKSGDLLPTKVHYESTMHIDSIIYFVDSLKVGSRKDSSILLIKTDSMILGRKTISAKVYHGGTLQQESTNIILLAAKPPEQMTYKIEKIFPHDTSAFTEGLLYQDGYLYESTGNAGHSTLRKVDLVTGKVIKITKLDTQYFGEGISIVGNKIIMLTYKQPMKVFIFDKNTFNLLSTFYNYIGEEGWGMTFDGNKLYFDDRTNRIWFLDKNNYRQKGFIDVCDDKAPIDSINELEYINGKLYSNIFEKDYIITIDPKTGAVLQRANMSKLWPLTQRPAGFDNGENVLNGIAWDEKRKRLFVTGKKWPHLYQIRFDNK